MRKHLFHIPFLIITIFLHSETIIPDGTFISGIWTQADSPYIIEGEAVIHEDSTLTIEPGVIVNFHTGTVSNYTYPDFDLGFLQVNGELLAVGNDTEPITFTRNEDEGYWGIIYFSETANPNSKLSYCIIEHGYWITYLNDDHFLNGVVSLYYSNIVIDHCQISNNNKNALFCISSSPLLTNNTFANNELFSICCFSSYPIVVNSIFFGNTGEFVFHAFEIEPSNPIVAYSLLQSDCFGTLITNAGNNIINLDPSFIDPENQNYNLFENSPCINTATNYFEWNDEVIVDLSEDEYFGIAPDMGAHEWYGTGTENNELSGVNLHLCNHPNPFNPSTTIEFSIQKDSYIELEIFNIKGQKIKTLANNQFTKGNHSIIWNGDGDSGESVCSGVYLYKLNVDGKTEAMKKCLLLK
ncbi:MAG: T9SS type A sorting domain-containing protein [Armatimonadetes bacterium]|nr:T9SS type A sorting domain-containing protein [Armatimonadota bacterium]